LNASDGKVVGNQKPREGKPPAPTQASNTYATETPATDGGRVYAHSGMHGAYAFDITGKEGGKRTVGSCPRARDSGTGSSPALADGKLFIQCDNEKESFLVALNARTGDEAWRAKRTERTGWSSPLVWKAKDRTEVVCIGMRRVQAYDAATGKELWELGGMSGQPKAPPGATREVLFVGTAGGPGR